MVTYTAPTRATADASDGSDEPLAHCRFLLGFWMLAVIDVADKYDMIAFDVRHDVDRAAALAYYE